MSKFNAPTRESPEEMCDRKRGLTQEQADTEAQRLGNCVHAYPCPVADHWHVGRKHKHK